MKTRKTYSAGSIFAAIGCGARIIQLAGAYFVPGLASNRILYMGMLCFLVGGFAVMIYEKRGRASLFALGATVSALMTTVMGNMSDGGDALRVLSAIFLCAMFVFAALIMLAKRSGRAKTAGGAVMLITAVLAVCTFCPVPGTAVAVLLISAYALVGVGINV